MTRSAAVQGGGDARAAAPRRPPPVPGDVDGAVCVKIVVSKRELKQMVAALGDGAGAVTAAAAATGERHRQRAAGGSCAGAGPGAEQRLQSLRRRSMRRAAEAARRMQASGEWEPGLQSIPEEVY